jgi:hypothetical protein
MKYKLQLHEQDKDLMRLQFEQQSAMEKIRYDEKVFIEQEETYRQEMKQTTNIAISDNGVKQQINQIDAKIDWLAKAAGMFRIIIGATSALFLYITGFMSMYILLKLYHILFDLTADNVIGILDITTRLPKEIKDIITFAAKYYTELPLDMIKTLFHTSIGIVTFYFGTTHASREFRNYSK